MIAPLLLAAAIAPATPEAAPATARVTVLWIRTKRVSYGSLAEDVRLRLPEVQLVPYGEERPVAPEGSLLLFVDVRPADDGAFALSLVASDGRAFDRIVEPEPGEAEELVARNIANLVFGIEAGTVPPDRADVDLPPPKPAPEPCPECPAQPEPAPEQKDDPQPPPREPRFELGPAFSLGVLTGLGPPNEVDRFAAWGGEVDLGFRLRNGGAVVVGLRPMGRTHPRNASIARFRVAVGGGYVWRAPKGGFELAALAGASVEPWLVRARGARVVFPDAPLPTIGGWARLAPGYLARGARVTARIGAYGELGVAYMPSSAGLVLVEDASMGETFPMFRVGGPELSLGIQTRLWFPVW